RTAPCRLSAASGGRAGEAARCAPRVDPLPGAVPERHARRALPARLDGGGPEEGDCALGHALAGRRRPFLPRAQVLWKDRRRGRCGGAGGGAGLAYSTSLTILTSSSGSNGLRSVRTAPISRATSR